MVTGYCAFIAFIFLLFSAIMCARNGHYLLAGFGGFFATANLALAIMVWHFGG